MDRGESVQLTPGMPRRRQARQLPRATREELQVARRAIGRLDDTRILPVTQWRYRWASKCFVCWCQRFGYPSAETFEELDTQLTEYMEWLWDSGFSKNEAGDAICGVQYFLRVKRKFPSTWAIFKAWTPLEQLVRAPPIPVQVLFVVARAAYKFNLRGEAAVLLIAFACYRRTTALRGNHLRSTSMTQPRF